MTAIESRVYHALSNGPLTTEELKREVTSLQTSRIEKMQMAGIIEERDGKWCLVIGTHVDSKEVLALLRKAATVAQKAGVSRDMFVAFAKVIY